MSVTKDPAVPMTETADLSDANAFGRWYDEQWPTFVATARRHTGDGALAEDIASEALLRSWQRWQVTGAPDRPAAYVATTIRNLAASHFRRAARDRDRIEQLAEPPTASPEATVLDREILRGLLPLLPTRERTAVVLHYLVDMSSVELAHRLAVPPVTVRSRLHRARRRLAAHSMTPRSCGRLETERLAARTADRGAFTR
jgi:RNA polymerase sigma-70 factor, ECF subfamily